MKADIEELSTLLEQATRPNVCSELQMTLRRVQTKLTNENERVAKVEAKSAKEAVKEKLNEYGDSSDGKSFTVEIKSYGWCSVFYECYVECIVKLLLLIFLITT